MSAWLLLLLEAEFLLVDTVVFLVFASADNSSACSFSFRSRLEPDDVGVEVGVACSCELCNPFEHEAA